MRITEILFCNNEPTEGNRSDSQLYLPHDASSDLFAKPANAYAKDRLLRRFWNAKGLEADPSGPPLPDAETECRNLNPIGCIIHL
jgi:hypothetical protein